MDFVSVQAWTPLWEALLQAWGPPVPALPPAGPTQASESAPHALDLHCRRAIGSTAAALPSAAAKRKASRALNSLRKALLSRWATQEFGARFPPSPSYVT